MASSIYPTLAQLAQGTLIAAPYSAATLHLLKATIPLLPSLTKAALVAFEADFTGYAAATLGGAPTVYPDPVRQGVSFNEPTTEFTVGGTPTVFNDIYGFYVLSAGSGTPLLLVCLFTQPYAMQAAGDLLGLEFIVNMFGQAPVSASINGVPQ